MAKQKTINREFKTVFFDYDGTMFDTAGADQYVARQKTLRRFSSERSGSHLWVAGNLP